MIISINTFLKSQLIFVNHMSLYMNVLLTHLLYFESKTTVFTFLNLELICILASAVSMIIQVCMFEF